MEVEEAVHGEYSERTARKMVQQGAGSLVRMCLKGFTNKTGKQESDFL